MSTAMVLASCTRRIVQVLVAVAEVAGRVPHLQVEVGHARTVEHVAAFAALEDLRRVDVMDGVAEGAVAGFVGQQLRIGGSGVGVGGDR
ncbi:hypothetical protein G6F23_015790 [Rhizopus arrhizus]|nr:hypothetical protein G6F23_015790 [Rhizopus arrhizus]